MKRKIYFLAAAVFQIIMAVYSIFSADKLLTGLKSQVDIYPEAMQLRVNELVDNSGHTFITVLAVVAIMLNILIFIWAYRDMLAKKRGKVIACSVGSLFTAMYPIVELIAVVNIIVIMATKKDITSEQTEEIKALPVLEKEIVDKRKIVMAVILLGIYFSQFLWSDFIPNNITIKIMVGAVFYILMIILSLIFFKDLFRENFKVFKNNYKIYFNNLIGSVGKFYLIYFLIATITTFLTKTGTSVNQNNVEALPIWYSLPLAVIYAPIVEETLFRGCIRRFVKNNKLFIVISAVVFGLLHTVFTEPSLYNAIVIAIPYMTIGGFLAYLYTKTNNMFTNMSFHAFQNTLAMIITILIKGI